MLNTIRILPKKIKIVGAVFFIAAFLCFLLIFNLEKTVNFIAHKFFGINLLVEDIDLSFGKIKINNIEIYDKKDRLMIDIPVGELSYSILDLKLNNLSIENPRIFLIKDEDGINIEEVFKKKKEKKEQKEEKNVEETKKEEKDENMATLTSNQSVH